MDTMSKSTALVAFSVLISLAAIVGISADFSGRLERALNANHANASQAAGVKDQAFLGGRGGITAPADGYYERGGDRPHGCHADSYYDPADD
jgi:hypothetical protein